MVDYAKHLAMQAIVLMALIWSVTQQPLGISAHMSYSNELAVVQDTAASICWTATLTGARTCISERWLYNTLTSIGLASFYGSYPATLPAISKTPSPRRGRSGV